MANKIFLGFLMITNLGCVFFVQDSPIMCAFLGFAAGTAFIRLVDCWSTK